MIAVPISDNNFEKTSDVTKVNELEELKKFLEEFKELKVESVLDSEHAKKSVENAIKLYKREFE